MKGKSHGDTLSSNSPPAPSFKSIFTQKRDFDFIMMMRGSEKEKLQFVRRSLEAPVSVFSKFIRGVLVCKTVVNRAQRALKQV